MRRRSAGRRWPRAPRRSARGARARRAGVRRHAERAGPGAARVRARGGARVESKKNRADALARRVGGKPPGGAGPDAVPIAVAERARPARRRRRRRRRGPRRDHHVAAHGRCAGRNVGGGAEPVINGVGASRRPIWTRTDTRPATPRPSGPSSSRSNHRARAPRRRRRHADQAHHRGPPAQSLTRRFARGRPAPHSPVTRIGQIEAWLPEVLGPADPADPSRALPGGLRARCPTGCRGVWVGNFPKKIVCFSA